MVHGFRRFFQQRKKATEMICGQSYRHCCLLHCRQRTMKLHLAGVEQNYLLLVQAPRSGAGDDAGLPLHRAA